MAKGKVNKRSVDALEPGKELWDVELKGFGVRARGSSKTFVLMCRADGRQRRLTIGRYGVLTSDEARKEAKRLLGRVASGKDPAGERKRGLTLGEVADCFVELHVEKKLKPRTIKEYRRLIDKRIKPKLGRLLIEKVERSNVNDLHQSLASIPRDANFTLAVASKLMSWAEKQGYRPDGSNPCRHVEHFPEKKRERFLSLEEVARLHAAMADDRSIATSALKLALLTGARHSEMLALEWAMVRFDRGVLALPDSKTGKKDIYLSKPAVELLESLPRTDERVFPVASLRGAWERVRAAAGLGDEVRIHDLRHTFASTAVAAGMSLPKIGKLLGHMTPQTTARYAHLDRSALQDDVEKIGELLG